MTRYSIVIPTFNEEKNIDQLCTSLLGQISREDEIIFVDAGSTDSTIEEIEKFTGVFTLKIIQLKKSLPGRGRNVGVEASQGDYVAFIDAGVLPKPDWLKNLKEYVALNKSPIAWGRCFFYGKSHIAMTIAALSSGHRSLSSFVIPASMFHRSVFTKTGGFNEDLRAGEDILFRRSIFKNYGNGNLCLNAVVEYSSFPNSFFDVAKKYYTYSMALSIGNVSLRHELLYYCCGLIIIGFSFSPIVIKGVIASIYIILRGVYDPIRRSSNYTWWYPSWSALLLAPVMAFLIDLSKLGGFLCGRFRLFTQRGIFSQ